MAITEMNFASGGGATSADKVSYTESDGTKTDLQTKVSELSDSIYYFDADATSFSLPSAETILYESVLPKGKYLMQTGMTLDGSITYWAEVYKNGDVTEGHKDIIRFASSATSNAPFMNMLINADGTSTYKITIYNGSTPVNCLEKNIMIMKLTN